MMTFRSTLPRRAHRGFGLLVGVTLAGAVAGSAEAADECQVSYTYTVGSGQSAVPQVEQTQVSANGIKTVNQEAMRYVINDRDWPVDVEVTVIGGGTKWVSLSKKGARDPAIANYAGSIELKRVKCLPGGTAGTGSIGAQSVQALVDQAFAASQGRRHPELHPHGIDDEAGPGDGEEARRGLSTSRLPQPHGAVAL